MKCKYEMKQCSEGWLFDNEGRFMGRCQCNIDKYKEAYFDWSEIANKKQYMKTVDELNKTFPIYFNMEADKQVDFKTEIKLLASMKDELLNNGIILTKGRPATGKTQFAATLAQTIFNEIDWDVDDSELELTPYYCVNISEMILNNVFFNQERLQIIQKKIRNAKILIIDEFGDELNRMKKDKFGNWIIDGSLARGIDFIKEITDKFNGLLILTSNNLAIEHEFLEKTNRLDIHSRLFGNIEKRDNVLVYGFDFDNERDLRDEQERKKMNVLKARF